MEVGFQRGVHLPELDLWLDSRRRREFGLISHAHSDHTARHQQPVMTRNTGLLLAEYFINGSRGSKPILLDYHEPLETEAYSLELYPAGHCLGSAQVMVTSKRTGERLLYTGDFKPRPSPTNEPLEPASCDILVMEATYGHPKYVFPPEEQALDTACRILRSWLAQGEKPVVHAWRLGKAQELLHILLGRGFDAALEESVYQVARTYEEGGVVFPGEFKPFDGRWPEGRVLICPPGKSGRAALEGVRGLRILNLTGWAADDGDHWARRGDANLPYSDHADFQELVDYVGLVRPKEVYTVNGFPDLAAHLRRLGYPAVHLDGAGRPDYGGFQMSLL